MTEEHSATGASDNSTALMQPDFDAKVEWQAVKAYFTERMPHWPKKYTGKMRYQVTELVENWQVGKTPVPKLSPPKEDVATASLYSTTSSPGAEFDVKAEWKAVKEFLTSRMRRWPKPDYYILRRKVVMCVASHDAKVNKGRKERDYTDMTPEQRAQVQAQLAKLQAALEANGMLRIEQVSRGKA
jgi:hypothetical protein